MRHEHLQLGRGFRIFIDHAHSLAVSMTLAPGGAGGGPGDGHKGRDQWLYVFSGCGAVVAAGEYVELLTGMLVLIEKGKTYEVRNTGSNPLKVLVVYAPPVSNPHRNERPAA
ncbi:MAG TPA: cupin domain-containing protein, partial [Urbifossiella sp.]|nr:cupin domain-containing protein [Urbifossiella sp.]